MFTGLQVLLSLSSLLLKLLLLLFSIIINNIIIIKSSEITTEVFPAFPHFGF